MALSKMEFMVENIKNKDDLKTHLLQNPNILRAEIVGKDAVVIETTLTCDKATSVMQNIAGGTAILWGLGEGGAAVAALDGQGVQGVVRFGGVKNCDGLIDGTIDGLPPGKLKIQIHTAGDLSNGCESLGPIWNPLGDLGKVTVDNNGRTEFKFTVPSLQIDQIIGRSFAIASPDDSKRYACGVIARSAGLFQNNKRICACDGVTLWDEKYLPAAGKGRRK